MIASTVSTRVRIRRIRISRMRFSRSRVDRMLAARLLVAPLVAQLGLSTRTLRQRGSVDAAVRRTAPAGSRGLAAGVHRRCTLKTERT